jgi:hypothetical protein
VITIGEPGKMLQVTDATGFTVVFEYWDGLSNPADLSDAQVQAEWAELVGRKPTLPFRRVTIGRIP